MGYLNNYLQPDEVVTYVAKIHFCLFAEPFLLLLLGLFLFQEPQGILHWLGLTILFLGVVCLIQRIMVKVGFIYAVTNKRLVLKTGIISRRVVDVVLWKCEGVLVNQSVFGRILNYGTIIVTTGGVTSSYFFVANPFRFKQEINTQIK